MKPLPVRILSAALVAALAVASATAAPRRTKTPKPHAPTATPTAKPTSTPPNPATLVPDPPYVGTPAAGERPYEAIVRAKEAGATEGQLLDRVAKEGVRYSLSTPDIQKLRAAGVSPRVIEAMLHSGRTPAPATTPSPAPGTATSPAPSSTPR
jgi:hypothetical protein